MKLLTTASACWLLAIILSGPATASPCDAHYSFDGTLADTTGNGYDGLMIAASGNGGEPQFGEGKYGQALHITGDTAMRSFLDLHHDGCPQFTITAWFKLPSVETGGAQTILSTGARGGIPAVVARDASITLYGSGNGLTQKNAIRDGNTWFFVAATFDYEARTYKLYWRNRSQEGKLSASPYNAEDSFWIGARSDKLRSVAQDLYVDDVRIYGRVLDLGEIRNISSNAMAHSASQNRATSIGETEKNDTGASSVPVVTQRPGSIENPGVMRPSGAPDLGSSDSSDRRSVGRVPDEIERSQIGVPSGAPELQYESPEAAEEAARQREEAAEARDQQQALDADAGKPRPVGDPAYSVVAGFTGEIQQSLDLETVFLHEIEWDQKNATPCIILVKTDNPGEAGGEKRLDVGCPRDLSGAAAKSPRVVRLYPSVITEIRVCNSRSGNTKLKGIQIGGAAIKDDGSLLYGGASDAESYTKCGEFTGPMLCPNHWAATGLVVHSADIRSDKGFISGLQLICRRISID